MSVRDVVKAELNIGQKPYEKSSRPTAMADVRASKRSHRSSKLEVIYRLSDAETTFSFCCVLGKHTELVY